MHQQSLFYPLHRLEKSAFPAIKASLTYVFFDCSRLYSSYKTSATDPHTLLGPRRRVPSSLLSLPPHDTASSGSRYLRRCAEKCVYLFMASNTSASSTSSHARDVLGSRKRT